MRPNHETSIVTAVWIGAIYVLAAGAFAVGLAYPPGSAAIDRGSRGAALSARQATTMLRLGSRGPEVRALQRSLVRLTYLPDSGIDGVFGMQTWHAVVALQGWNYLPRDGIVGPRTRSALSQARGPRHGRA